MGAQQSILSGPYRTIKANFLHKMFEDNREKRQTGNSLLIYDDLISGVKRFETYHEMNKISNQLAVRILEIIRENKLQANADGDWIIGVCMSLSDNLIKTILSIFKVGAAYLPFDKTFPHNRVQHILQESSPVLVICDSVVDRSLFKGTITITFHSLLRESHLMSDVNIPTQNTLSKEKSDLAVVMYTSGSTGAPKGVRIRHTSFINRLEWQWEFFPYSPTEKTTILKTSLTFIDAIIEIWNPLLSDLTLVIIPNEITKDPERLIHILETYKIERIMAVPTLLHSILMCLSVRQQHLKQLANLKLWIGTGEPLLPLISKKFFDYFEDDGTMLGNFYGTTELSSDVLYFVCKSKSELELFDKIPIGRPINNTMVYLLDSNKQPVLAGKTGELYVSGSSLAMGYVNNRDPDRFDINYLEGDDPTIYNSLFATGDYASIQHGEIVYEGRKDSQINIRGTRVDLSEIEAQLSEHPDIEDACVLCYRPGEVDQAILGYVTLAKNSEIQTGLEIEKFLDDKLTHYMIPQVIIIEKFPFLLSGKIDRLALLELYAKTITDEGPYVGPCFDYSGVLPEKMKAALNLFETIGQVIGRSSGHKITLLSNFYELGGNSLNSVMTVTQLRNKGYYISITDFIDARNLGEIVDKILVTKPEVKFQLEPMVYNTMKLKKMPLSMELKEETFELLISSFHEKSEFDRCLKTERKDYAEVLESLWEFLVQQNLSFIVEDENGRMVGASLNYDLYEEPEWELHNILRKLMELMKTMEDSIKDQRLPWGKGKVFNAFMMGTSKELSAAENVHCISYMENELIQLARQENFLGVFTTNVNPLTYQLCADVYGYETMLEYQANQFVASDGSRPFADAPNTQYATVQWKRV